MKSVLIVDDSKVFRSIIKKATANIFQNVYEAGSIVQARQILEDNVIDCILLDRELPDGDGITFCGELKGEDEYLITQIIIVSSDDSDETRKKATDNKAVGFVAKDEIEEKLRTYILSLLKIRHLAPFKGKVAVIIEDSDSQRNYLKGLLEQIGMRAIPLATYKDAYEFFSRKNHQLDIIFSDYHLDKDMTAGPLIEMIRAQKKLSKIPIIAITSSKERDVRKDLYLKGVNDFLEKPFELEDFYLRLHAHLRNKMLFDILQEKNRKLIEQAITDPLTGLYNRRYFYDQLSLCHVKEQQGEGYYAVILFDIDYFKKVNDEFGHYCGDEVLIKISALAKEMGREQDTVARFGGEEFIILLPDTSIQDAKAVAERLRRQIEQTTFPCVTRQVTSSFGVASSKEKSGSERVITLADNRLYHAKKFGRNRVESTVLDFTQGK